MLQDEGVHRGEQILVWEDEGNDRFVLQIAAKNDNEEIFIMKTHKKIKAADATKNIVTSQAECAADHKIRNLFHDWSEVIDQE